MIRFKIGFIGLLFAFQLGNSQSLSTKSTAALYQDLQSLNFLGNVMFIAAHPDDENTRLISYLTHEIHAHTAYLSLTRGDGGQNLIGTEIRELLGVLRTQELLKARSIDGGIQYFTRANDFGYSKHPDETLKTWNKEEVLSDVVDRIRQFRPDVIINRFDHRTPGSTHGHHTSSAILSVEAFDLSNNPQKIPLRTEESSPWQPKRMFFNTSWWFYGSQEAFKKADHSHLVSMDVGVYYPLLGISNNEIASLASSQHLCQGFGRLISRGSEPEYLEFIKGDKPNNNDIFEGIDTSWNRIEGGREIGEILYKVESQFNFKNPSVHTADLLKAYQKINLLKDPFWRKQKLEAITRLILDVNGIWIDANASQAYASPGDEITVHIEAINRSSQKVSLSVRINRDAKNTSKSLELSENKKTITSIPFTIPIDQYYNTPYWLEKQPSVGTYRVDNKDIIGLPETPNPLKTLIELTINEVPIQLSRDLLFRHAAPDKGEIVAPFSVLPPVSLKFSDKVVLFTDNQPKDVQISVKSLSSQAIGSLSLNLPEGWSSFPKVQTFNLTNKGSEQIFTFKITPSSIEKSYLISADALINNRRYSKEYVEINYDHIPKQSVLLVSNFKAVRVNIQKKGTHIGYIMGAGDEVPESLKQIGYQVYPLGVDEITTDHIANLDAIVIGVRAYNVHPNLIHKKEALLKFVSQGGTLITQYNTPNRNGLELITPYPLHISRDRVAEEDSKVSFIDSNSPLLKFPNRISDKDFEDWVQERGLYFPDSWDPNFKPVIEIHDLNESPKEGSLLIAAYGKGHFIYTGLSFFRELPAGVPGAFKLFANMLSSSKNTLEPEKIKN